MTQADVARAHQAYHELPYGRSQIVAAEEFLRLADAHQPDLAFTARLHLLDACARGGEAAGLFVPFTWCVTEYDKDPGRHARHLVPLLWRFKDVQSALNRFPDVPLDAAYAALEEMDRRYRAAGRTLEPVHRARHRIAAHVGDVQTAEREFHQWRITPRDPQLSDCIGCDPTSKASYFSSTGRHEEAILEGEPVLSETLTCTAQPHGLLTALMPAYMETGRYQEASRAHTRSYPKVRDSPTGADVEDHIFFCAMTGNADLALAMVERHWWVLDRPTSPMTEMYVAASCSLALATAAAGTGRRSVRVHGEDRAAGEIAEELRVRALDIAERFDRRNGTSRRSQAILELLDSTPWTTRLPLHTTP